MEKPILQVALDLVELKRALEIAEEAIIGGADWIEAGTPLIKSEGMNAVRELKEVQRS
jgi:3-hexulose-6-phosphate synthase/6-phospho-3-hexuloisomerase